MLASWSCNCNTREQRARRKVLFEKCNSPGKRLRVGCTAPGASFHFVTAPTKAQQRSNFKKNPYPFHISQKPPLQTHMRTILTIPSDLLTAYPRPHTERGCRERLKLILAPCCRGRRNWIARHQLRRMRSKIERNVLRCSKTVRVAGDWDEARCEEPYWTSGGASQSATFLQARVLPEWFKCRPLFCKKCLWHGLTAKTGAQSSHRSARCTGMAEGRGNRAEDRLVQCRR